MSMEEDTKNQLLLIIFGAKNRAFDQVQTIKILAANNINKFIIRVSEMVKKVSSK